MHHDKWHLLAKVTAPNAADSALNRATFFRPIIHKNLDQMRTTAFIENRSEHSAGDPSFVEQSIEINFGGV